VPPSRSTASTLRSAFRQQVLPRFPLAQVAWKPATVLAALPPASQLPASLFALLQDVLPVAAFAVSFQPSWRSAAPSELPSCPGRRTERVRRLSTSAIITVPEHDRATNHPPRTRRRELPLNSELMRAALCLAARRWPSCHGIRGHIRFSAYVASPRRARRGELCPDPERLEHPMSRTRVDPDRSSQHRWEGQVPTRSPADDASAARARATSPSLPRRGPGSAHPRCFFIEDGSEEPAPVVHKLSPTCGVTGCGAFGIDVSSQRR
jgi:hypothetical protein